MNSIESCVFVLKGKNPLFNRNKVSIHKPKAFHKDIYSKLYILP